MPGGETVKNDRARIADMLAAQLNLHVTPRTDRPHWASPGEMAADLDPKTLTTPALELIDEHLVWATAEPGRKLILSMPPQEGKSQRVSRDFVLWALAQNPERRIAVASKDAGLSRRNGRAVRDLIQRHSERLRLEIRRDVSAQAEWQVVGHAGGLIAVTLEGGFTGRSADLIVIDDPVNNRSDVLSEAQRNKVWDWFQYTMVARMSANTPVVLIMTRWHEDDLVGRILASEDGPYWRVLNIPAQANHDPKKGETDPLGREPGEYMVSVRGRTKNDWDQRKRMSGSTAWEAQYQGNPSPPEGGMFKRDNWRFYDNPQWLIAPDGTHWVSGFDAVISSWDMAFKDKKDSDFVVGQVWARRGANAFLLDQVRGRWDFPETVRQVVALAAKWRHSEHGNLRPIMHLVEDKANGTAVVAALHNSILGLVADEPHGSKVARASVMTPLHEAHQLWLPSPTIEGVDGASHAPWVGDFVEEYAGFPNATHDDQVDAGSQAINRLIIQPFADGRIVTPGDLDDDLDDDYRISNY